jgi:hypothetical protein
MPQVGVLSYFSAATTLIIVFLTFYFKLPVRTNYVLRKKLTTSQNGLREWRNRISNFINTMLLLKLIVMSNRIRNFFRLYTLTFLTWYLAVFFLGYLVYILFCMYTDWLIFSGNANMQCICPFKDTQNQIIVEHGPEHNTLLTFNTDNMRNLSLQEKIAYSIALLDIHLLVGIDVKAYANGIAGALHVGVEASTLSNNVVFNAVHPYSILIKIPFNFIYSCTENLSEVSEIITQNTPSMQPSQLKTVISAVGDISEYGGPQQPGFATKIPLYKGENFSISFGVKIPFEHIDDPKKYSYGISLTLD